MGLRQLTEDDVHVEILVEPEYMPVRGNAMASGDDSFDTKVEDDILARLEAGDIWAWACVQVEVSWRPMSGGPAIKGHSPWLGGCSYADESDFLKGGYYVDLLEEALDDLNTATSTQFHALKELEN